MFSSINAFLNGKKTLIGIFSGVATFVLVVTTALADGFQIPDLQIIGAGFAALMVAIGLNGKAAKILDELKK